MKKLMLLLSALFAFALGCATTQEPQYPDEEQIRDNADKSHGELKKEESKQNK